ncbi:septal ring lytic transglycosylase RlpA family protein [Flavisolibacter tropicus]|uniref:septal ring lytic transglycosylase RlpA family protein n=1 Tax=Flavisolibacter tropicus TaxID=1492898 RepID=UPI000829D702|nr:septal ring lytic transglycosylase RlpA family protein [Flavisolibacter tropicus]
MKPSYRLSAHLYSYFLFMSVLVVSWFSFAQCHNSTTPPPQKDTVKETKTGLASYYGHAFEGEETASGETFHLKEMVAAHPTYPLGTVALITNLEEGGSVVVRIIDRGPTDENVAEGVIIDLSKGAAQKLGMVKEGRIKVKVEVLQWGTNEYNREKDR